MIRIPLGDWIESGINWFNDNASPLLDGIAFVVGAAIDFFEFVLTWPHSLAMIPALAALAWLVATWKMALAAAAGLLLIDAMDMWDPTMQTLALVLASTAIALLIGVPVGVLAARSAMTERIVRPVLDFMQTMPAFVYLIPAVLFFGTGNVPGAMATVIFAAPPAVRLTTLGIRQVPRDVVDAADAFGATEWQKLVKVQLPLALPTILAGVNQTIMLALSMVVIAALIGAPGVGTEVVEGVQRLNLSLGFESGLAIVILAIFLDRITQAAGGGRAAAT